MISIDCLLCARHYKKCLVHIKSFNCSTTHKVDTIIIPFIIPIIFTFIDGKPETWKVECILKGHSALALGIWSPALTDCAPCL